MPPMRLLFFLSTAPLPFAPGGLAFASSCSEQIATIERRLNSAGAEQVTGKEPPGGATSSNSPKALDQPPGVKPSGPKVQPSAAGVEEARKLIQKARNQEKA